MSYSNGHEFEPVDAIDSFEVVSDASPSEHAESVELPADAGRVLGSLAMTDSVEAENPPEKRNTKNEWQREFRTRVGKAIEELANDDLLTRDAMTAHMLSRRSSSDKLGTIESVERMTRANILPRATNTNPGLMLLEAKDIVAMYMLNTEPALSLNSRRKQKAALRLIDECVESYLDKQDEA